MYGVSEELFWTLNPNRLRPYIKAYEKREEKRAKDIDMTCWLIGRYCSQAVTVAISNCFSKKKLEYQKKPNTYMDTEEKNEQRYAEMSEEEKLIEVRHIFSMLTAVESRIQKGGE